jgi:DNA-binding LacI/PurR family transcriptional regulator
MKMRKRLPYILGLASLLWIIGGTYWYKNRFCDLVLQPVYTPTNVSQVATFTELEIPFQALNLYYPKKKFQFKITDDLSAYFNTLKDYLNHNKAAKIAIFAKNTYGTSRYNREGGDIGQKRLTYFRNTLKDKAFDLNQFEFHNTEFQHKPISYQEDDVKNQSLEIRLAVP